MQVFDSETIIGSHPTEILSTRFGTVNLQKKYSLVADLGRGCAPPKMIQAFLNSPCYAIRQWCNPPKKSPALILVS